MNLPTRKSEAPIKKGFVPRPIHMNKTKGEFKDWFKNCPPWHKVNPIVIETLIDKMYGKNDKRYGNSILEVFVHGSRDGNLIREYYGLEDAKGEVDTYQVCGKIATILFQRGTLSANRIKQIISSASLSNFDRVQSELKNEHKIAIETLESAIAIEPIVVESFIQLAEVRLMFEKTEAASDICARGLAQIADLRVSPLTFANPAFGFMDELDRMEATLRALEVEIASKVKIKNQT